MFSIGKISHYHSSKLHLLFFNPSSNKLFLTRVSQCSFCLLFLEIEDFSVFLVSLLLIIFPLQLNLSAQLWLVVILEQQFLFFYVEKFIFFSIFCVMIIYRHRILSAFMNYSDCIYFLQNLFWYFSIFFTKFILVYLFQ